MQELKITWDNNKNIPIIETKWQYNCSQLIKRKDIDLDKIKKLINK